MEAINEIIPFTKEMLSQTPNWHMMKFYLVGSAVGFLGVTLGLVEMVCQPFMAEEPLDEELKRLEEREKRLLKAEKQKERTEESTVERQAIQPNKKLQQTAARQRSSANRLHAS